MAMYFYFLFNECLVQDGGQKSGRNVTKVGQKVMKSRKSKEIRREILM
jgi:hypothetical protein